MGRPGASPGTIMPSIIRRLEPSDRDLWEDYVRQHPLATYAHLPGFGTAVRKAYHLNAFALGAFRKAEATESHQSAAPAGTVGLVGLLPLVHLRHRLFGNDLVSMPFLDSGGILADDAETERALLNEALKWALREKVQKVELRHASPMLSAGSEAAGFAATAAQGFVGRIHRHKVRMILDLPPTATELMQSFKSKLRSQVRKPMRDGLCATVGGIELLNHFYGVFCVNMRDLGSPVHSEGLLRNVIEVIGADARVVLVYLNEKPLAAGIVIGFGDCLYNPWASSLDAHKKLNPNMLLYWTMLEYACDQRYRRFDFGRSTPDEGTYNFKAQWGARPAPLYWHTFSQDGQAGDDPEKGRARFALAIRCWKMLPVGVTRWVGPRLRKHISL
jgi:serine/alanine adding enzyme